MIRYAKWAIWLYVILLIFEGALRKWVLPGFSEYLLIVRDPVVLLIYALAIAADRIPQTPFFIVIGALALMSIAFSFISGQTNLLVLIYGIRTNYLHLPLIWVMAAVLDREDVEKLGSFLLLTCIPMTILMAFQWDSPQSAWVNRGVGGNEDGGIYGALGRMRPPGFFSFITGVMVYYPLVTAFALYQIGQQRRLWWPVLLVCATAIIIALPISISRGAVISTSLVALAFLVCILIGSALGFRVGGPMLLRALLAGALLIVALSFLPIFKEAQAVFMERWDTAANEAEGNAWASLYQRVVLAFSTPMMYASDAPTFGYGVGVGSNVGASLLAGRRGFLLTEDEWGKCLYELGPMLGFAFIFFRIFLVIYLLVIATVALIRHRDTLPMLIWSACFPVVLFNQWGQATQLGFAVIGGGLLVAATVKPPEDEEEEETEDDETDDEDEDEELSPVEVERRRMRGLT